MVSSSDPPHPNPPEYFEPGDPAHVKRERHKARDLRGSVWWKQQIGRGVCYHCGGRFVRENLTMDHLIPLSRGGRSNKKNIVVSCKQCNSHKKNLTMAEIRLRELNLP
ncbi:MAG: HNH endonuclease [Bdellovibrionales bacterium]